MALTAARRIADVALDRFPLDTVEHTIRQCLAQAAHEARVVIRVNADIAEMLKTRIGEIADEIGFAGRIVVAADLRAAAADCRLEWTDGGGARRSRHRPTHRKHAGTLHRSRPSSRRRQYRSSTSQGPEPTTSN